MTEPFRTSAPLFAEPAGRAPEAQGRRRRFRRSAACVGACVGVGAGAGVVHMLCMFLGTMVFTGGPGGGVVQFLFTTLLGAIGGVVLGLMFAAPFAAIAYRRMLSNACAWMLTACAGVSLLAMLVAGTTVSLLEGHISSNFNLWLQFLAVVVFASPLLGMGVGLLLVAKLVPATWLPFPTGCCQFCGYDRSGLASDRPCPECGTMLAAEVTT